MALRGCRGKQGIGLSDVYWNVRTRQRRGVCIFRFGSADVRGTICVLLLSGGLAYRLLWLLMYVILHQTHYQLALPGVSYLLFLYPLHVVSQACLVK